MIKRTRRSLGAALAIPLMGIVFLVMIAHPRSALAAELAADNIVSLSYSPNPMNHGEVSSISLEFSDGSDGTGTAPHPIRSGDTITVSWPTEGSAYLTGIAQTTPLLQDGVQLATLTITEGGATITFTDAVDGLYAVHGTAEISVVGHNTTGGAEDTDEVATVTAGGRQLDVTVHRWADGPVGFSEKWGNVWESNPDRISWQVVLNRGGQTLYDGIDVVDELGPGHVILLDSLTFFRAAESEEQLSLSEFLALDGNTAEIGSDTIVIHIAREHVSGVPWMVSYDTEIVDASLDSYGNEAQIANVVTEDGASPVGFSNSRSVSNPYAGGSVTGLKPGTFRVTKTVVGTSRPVEGVTFAVWREDGGVVLDGKTRVEMTTGATGKATVEGLVAGAYLYQETSCPEWLELDDEVRSFEVHSDDAQGIAVALSDEIRTIDVGVRKVWDDSDDADVIRPASVTVRLLADGNDTGFELVLSDENGWEGSFLGLPVATERGEEIAYALAELEVEGYQVAVTGSAKEGFVVTNTHEATVVPEPVPEPDPEPDPVPEPAPGPEPSVEPTPMPVPEQTSSPVQDPKPATTTRTTTTPNTGEPAAAAAALALLGIALVALSRAFKRDEDALG